MELNWLQRPLTHLAWAAAAVSPSTCSAISPMQVQDWRVQRELMAEDWRAGRDIKLKFAEIKLGLAVKGVERNTALGHMIGEPLDNLGNQLLLLDQDKGLSYDLLP